MNLYFEELPVGLRLSECIPENGDTELVIPAGVTSVAPAALRRCGVITHLSIPCTLQLADADPLVTMTALRRIIVDRDHPDLISRDGILFRRDGQNGLTLLCYPAGRVNKTYVIPEDVCAIGQEAFANSVHLEKVLLHARVEEVGRYAFSGDAALRYVQFDCKKLRLGEGAFRFCNALTTVCVRGSIARIGDYAFDGCGKLARISFPEGLEAVGRSAFGYCSKLETIVLPATVSVIGMNAFYQCGKLQRIHCPRSVARLIPAHHDITCITPTFEED